MALMRPASSRLKAMCSSSESVWLRFMRFRSEPSSNIDIELFASESISIMCS